MARRDFPSFVPIALAIVASVFSAGAAYTGWLDARGRDATPPMTTLTPVRAAPPTSHPAPLRQVAPPSASPQVVRCVAEGQAPHYTSTECPAGMREDRRIAVEIDPASERRRARAAPSASAPSAVASASATVVNVGGGGHHHHSRAERRDLAHEAAFDRCERAKVTERARMHATPGRKMSDIRRWEAERRKACAELAVYERR